MIRAIISRFFNPSSKLAIINLLHFFNDGYEASFILLLPFIAKDLHINLTQVGLLGSLFNACGVILALYSSFIAAKFGGMKSLVYIIILSTLVFIVTGFVPGFIFLLLIFTIAGVGFGLFHPILWSSLSHLSTKNTRGKAMGDSAAIGDIGRIGMSTILTFIVVGIGWKITSFIYGVVGLFIAIFIYHKLHREKSLHIEQQSHTKVNIVQLFNNKKFVFSVLILICDVFASLSIYIFLPFLFLSKGISISFLGAFTAVFFVGNFLGKLYFGRLADKYGNSKMFFISETLMAVSIFALAQTTIIPLIILLAFGLGAFTKGTIPIVGTIIAESVEHHGDFNKTFSITESISSFVRVVAPILLGIISDKFGIISAFNVMALVALVALIPAVGFQLSKTK